MTDRYSVDALAPQYEEIAGICMMGKPVILTREDQELVLMNPVEFRKMMQLVSNAQANVKSLENDLADARESLASTRDELASTQEELTCARNDLADARAQLTNDQEKAGQEVSKGFFEPYIEDEEENLESMDEADSDAGDDVLVATDNQAQTGSQNITRIVFDGPVSDRKAHFLKNVSYSLERRGHMIMEPVPEGLAIETEGLTRKYSGVTANSSISLHVPYGAVYGLLGRTGSGRSTLVRTLLGLSFPNSGKITLCNSTGKELNDIRELTGSVLDAPVLYEHLSINQNMVFRAKMLRLKTPKPAIKEALKCFGLFDRKRKKVRTLSTGEKQKLALALAILGNPEILILDEPLKGLDEADKINFCKVMMDMNAKGSTILITDSQTDPISSIATHYGILQDGELIREISAKQILEDPIDLDTEYLAAEEV